jgi:8-oxo-dGTP pyrophosphatase MutT (NUDIX family)
VAIVVHDLPGGPELLFIERAERLGDPWSGQMAFPGGRVDPGDPDARAAAERETREEIGLDLAGAELLGRLDDVNAGVRLVAPLVLSSFVYRVEGCAPLVPNHEVREALLVPVRTIVDPNAQVRHRWGVGRFPGILVGEPGRHVVWGLTHQLVVQLVGLTGAALPSR